LTIIRGKEYGMNVGWLARLGGVALALGLIYGGFDLAGATGPPSNVTGIVTVGNDASNPVPVQQQGTATVNVNNTPLPVQQQGTATVNVSNTPLPVTGTVKIDPTANTVQLGGTATVHTQAADNPAFEPVGGGASLNAGDGDVIFSGFAYTVPAGKELVIQSATFAADLLQGEHILFVAITTDHGTVYLAPLSDESSDTRDEIVGGGPITLYASPGDQVSVRATRFPTNAESTIEVDFTGYLVNLP
jgi:hypothetical protein